MRTITDPTEVRYALDVIMDLSRVSTGDKPLLIVSEGKSTLAYETVAELASQAGLTTLFATFVCEDGELHEHVFVAQDSAFAVEAIELIFERAGEHISRLELQIRLGSLLGYSALEIVQFTRSLIGMTCSCDCCGGPPPLLLTYQVQADNARDVQRDITYLNANKARNFENCYQF